MKVAVMGDTETVAGFALAGVKISAVLDESGPGGMEEAAGRLKEFTDSDDIGVLIITERWADLLRKEIDLAKRLNIYPIIVEIPDKSGKLERKDPLTSLIRRAVGVEVHSLSKGWNMICWRIGWVCGHERLVSAFADVKDNCDSGQFIAIQKAAVAALDDPEIPQRTREKYHRRLKKLVGLLTEFGFDCRVPGGSYFLYTASPKGVAGGVTFGSAEAAAHYLITEHSICTVPWDDVGPYLRFAATYEAADAAAEDELMAETEARLKKIQPLF